MPRIRQDDLGLYVAAGGYRGRPMGETAFDLGAQVKAHHRNQTTIIVVRSIDGGHEERWIATESGTTYKALEHAQQHGWITEEEYRRLLRFTLYNMVHGTYAPRWAERGDPIYDLRPGAEGARVHDLKRALEERYRAVRRATQAREGGA